MGSDRNKSPRADRRLYALGALPSLASTYLSIAFIFAVQLHAAIAPRIWLLDRC